MEKQSKILKWSLIVGIVIVLNLFFNYTLSLVYKNPDYNNFCTNTEPVIESITDQDQCLAVGGQWNKNVYFEPTTIDKNPAKGFCDQDFSCRNDYEAARKIYDRNVFATLVLLGAICVAIGSYLKKNILLSIAISLAGVLSFIISSMRYWTSANDLVKVVILAIALVILIYVALKKFQN